MILYQDPHLLIALKPAGLPTQAPRGGGDNLFDRLRAAHDYVGLHHRLDTPVEGLVLFTLDKGVNAAISAAFKEHRIHRSYQALVVGDPGPQGSWTTPLDGQPAHTDYLHLPAGEDMLPAWAARHRPGRTTALAITLQTGRTHQIRRHCADAGHPILGDRRHGGAASRLAPNICLRAVGLRLTHPVTGQTLELRAPQA
ncbi:MAG: RluA family pseudouridine synthase [Myxococcota bacterium]|nr:RluA family pseudouridine synthase [Myxococcota bacterium]